jgi:hypothetical protein
MLVVDVMSTSVILVTYHPRIIFSGKFSVDDVMLSGGTV